MCKDCQCSRTAAHTPNLYLRVIGLDIKRRTTAIKVLAAVFLAAIFFYGNIVIFTLMYFALFLFASFRTLQSTARKRTRLLLILSYFIVMTLQMTFYAQVVAGFENWMEHPFRKLFAVILMLLPIIISRYVAVGRHVELYLPSFEETVTISFSQMREFTGGVAQTAATVKKSSENLTPDNFKKIIDDLPRHDSFRYVNAGSLTGEYFQAAEASLNDLGIYIIISNTGTPASEIISVFTQKQFNHASLAFDAKLQTIVSYNGGEQIYPPGLNFEMVDFFYKKPDASILIYRLPVTYEQKRAAIDKIAQLNREGSAYNILGLLINQSYKPNIMYCSQFVYHILDHIDATYFEPSGTIKPTDLIEKDYLRKLEFVEELRLGAEGSVDSGR